METSHPILSLYNLLSEFLPLTPVGQLKPYLSEEEYAYVMKMDNKPNAIISLQSKHLRKLNSEKKFWDFSLLKFQGMLKMDLL